MPLLEKNEKHDERFITKGEQKCIKEMWGPILVDKWPGRKPQDGHTVMEKLENGRQRLTSNG
jgi:hypothetical protein